MSDATREMLGTIGKLLFWCWIFGFAIQLISAVALLGFSDMVYELYSSWFGLSQDESEVIFISYLALIKLSVAMLFFVPWLAIKMVLRTPKG